MSKNKAESAGADAVTHFETGLTELEGIVARLERGDLPLEESLQLFERGMSLSRDCRGLLERAELRVRNLLQQHAGPPAESAESPSPR
jgi:exodeoxyribonuclease VII small subunit